MPLYFLLTGRTGDNDPGQFVNFTPGAGSLQAAYDGGTTIALDVDTPVTIGIDPASNDTNGIAIFAAADNIAGTSHPAAVSLTSQGHTSPGEGGPGGVPTTLLATLQAIASGGAMSGIVEEFDLSLNNAFVTSWIVPAANNKTVLWLMYRDNGGALQFANVVRDNATGNLQIP